MGRPSTISEEMLLRHLQQAPGESVATGASSVSPPSKSAHDTITNDPSTSANAQKEPGADSL
jgi:hypothetical protein